MHLPKTWGSQFYAGKGSGMDNVAEVHCEAKRISAGRKGSSTAVGGEQCSERM
jgi:hypothetical protein